MGEFHFSSSPSYHLHFSELTFLERIEHVLTRAQVQVKSEVTVSNTQAKGIFEELDKLGKMLEDCSHPFPLGEVCSNYPSDIIWVGSKPVDINVCNYILYYSV